MVENVATARALRKWLLRHRAGIPADLVVYLDLPMVARSRGQRAMAKGVATVFAEIRPELERRGAVILEPNT